MYKARTRLALAKRFGPWPKAEELPREEYTNSKVELDVGRSMFAHIETVSLLFGKTAEEALTEATWSNLQIGGKKELKAPKPLTTREILDAMAKEIAELKVVIVKEQIRRLEMKMATERTKQEKIPEKIQFSDEQEKMLDHQK